MKKMKSQVGIAIAVWLATLNGLVGNVFAADHRLTVEVDGFQKDNGAMGVNIFSKQDDMFEHPFRSQSAKIVNGKSAISFDDLPLGEYAIVAFHDQNSNGKLDHHFIGFPIEPIAYSNDFHFSVFSGMPTFEKLKIGYRQQQQNLYIHLEN